MPSARPFYSSVGATLRVNGLSISRSTQKLSPLAATYSQGLCLTKCLCILTAKKIILLFPGESPERGICDYILTALSLLIFICTLPLSLCFCMKVGCIILSQ